MADDKFMAHILTRPLGRQNGSFAVEFSLVIIVFLTLIFCVIEIARVMYMWNTLQEVTRRAASAAARTDFSDVSAMNSVRNQAVFRATSGLLPAGDPVTDAYVRIDYMSLARASDGRMTLTPIPNGTLPSCPARNQVACAADPNAASCIRFVRVRICAPGSDATTCDPVPYAPIMPIVNVASLTLPLSTTIARAETLGYTPGQSLCP
jgi:hypothetical protein